MKFYSCKKGVESFSHAEGGGTTSFGVVHMSSCIHTEGAAQKVYPKTGGGWGGGREKFYSVLRGGWRCKTFLTRDFSIFQPPSSFQ